MKLAEPPKRGPNRTLEQKALTIIEAITDDDFCESLEMAKYRGELSDRLLTLTNKIMAIYRYSHAVLATCNHGDWKAELLQVYRKYKRHRII